MDYKLKVKNNSENFGNFCVYQMDPVQKVDDIMSLVWMTKSAQPQNNTVFNWATDYSFSWADNGELMPGTIFKASEVKSINLDVEAKTASTLFTDQEQAYRFKQTDQLVPAGKLGILTDAILPEKSCAIGIHMDKNPAFALEAKPDLNYTFKPNPQYWIVYGDFKEGEVIDPSKLSGALPLDLSEDKSSCTVTLQKDGSLKID